MTLNDITADICAQLGDPEQDTYGTRARSHLVRAIFNAIAAKQYQPVDVSGYLKRYTSLAFNAAGQCDISGLDILDIHAIYPDPLVDKEIIITMKEISDLNGIASNSHLKPSDDDLFIYQVGDTLYSLISDSSNFNYSTDLLHMVYIEDIDTSGWEDSTLLSDKFSRRFLTTCIGQAVQTLKQEDQLTEM